MTELAATEVATDSLRIPRFQDAYQRVKEEMDALAKEDLLVVNVDIPSAVALTLGALPEIRKLRERAAKLSETDIVHFDKVEQRALAMGYAHSLHLAASAPVLPLQELSARAIEMRETLLSDATALAKRNLLDGERLKLLKGPIGYKNQASDLLTLVAMMRGGGARIQGKTAVQPKELDDAEIVADQLLTAVGEREQLPIVAAATFETRQRAFTLFVTSYDEIRRAASYLRWREGDVDELVPSLYAGRKRKGSANAEEPEQPPAATTPATNGATLGAPAPTGASVAVGMPGSDPFTA